MLQHVRLTHHHLRLAIVGDDRYLPKHKLRIPAYPNRMFLHAAKIELPDGRVFEAPLPEELERCVVALRSRPVRTNLRPS